MGLGPGPMGPGPRPMATILIRLYLYIIIFFYILFYIFSKSFELLCAVSEFKIAFSTPSKNFQADFLNFDIFHRFSPKTYFWGWTATTTVAAVEFPQTSNPHSHHAQGSHIPFGHPPSLRYIFMYV